MRVWKSRLTLHRVVVHSSFSHPFPLPPIPIFPHLSHLSPSGRRGGSALVASPPERRGLRRSHAELCAVPWRGATLGAAAHSTLDTGETRDENPKKQAKNGSTWMGEYGLVLKIVEHHCQLISIGWLVDGWISKFGYWRCKGRILVCFGTKEQLYLSNCPRWEIVHPGCNPIPLILNTPPYGPQMKIY